MTWHLRALGVVMALVITGVGVSAHRFGESLVAVIAGILIVAGGDIDAPP